MMNLPTYNGYNYITFDFETTNIDKGSALEKDNELILVSWAVGLGKVQYALKADTTNFLRFIRDLNNASFIVAHNAKFELQWLQRLGFNLHNILVWDTMVAEYVYLGNRKLPLNLGQTCARYGIAAKSGFIPLAISSGICPSCLPARWVADYCKEDVTATRSLFLYQLDKYKHLLPVIYTRCLLIPVLADIESNGMHIDKSAVTEEYKVVIEEERQILRDLDTLTGGINPASPKQVAAFLYDELGFKDPNIGPGGRIKYKTKARSTDKKTIERLAPVTEKQKKFIELKQKQSLLAAKLSKTLGPLYRCVTETDDHILYGVFNQCVTETQRLSSSGRKYGVQFQNFPRKYKYFFTPRDSLNDVVVEVDEAQLEFRAAVFLGQDKQGMEDIKNNIDVHSFTAAVLNDSTYEYVYKNKDADKKIASWRQEAKSDTFKPLYGGQSGTQAQVKYYKAFRQKYADITKTQENWKYKVLNNKKLETCTGLIFYWPDTTITGDGYITNSTKICNYPVQSLATADIVPIGLRLLWDSIYKAGIKAILTNTVHDSVIAEVNKNDVDKFKEIAVHCFTSGATQYLLDIYKIEFNVPLEAEIKTGPCWGGKR